MKGKNAIRSLLKWIEEYGKRGRGRDKEKKREMGKENLEYVPGEAEFRLPFSGFARSDIR